MKSVSSVVRGSVFACVIGAVVTLSSLASARDSADPVDCVSDGWNTVTCTIVSGGSESTFLGAFASDNGGAGGWTEFYSDEDGEWWVEHHADGGTSVGWEANFISGPKMGNKEGSYSKKPRPAVKGVLRTGPKKTFAAAKAKAAATTGTLASISAGPVTTAFGSLKFGQLAMQGSGQCKASIVVSKDGKFVSATGIVPVSFPSNRPVALPSEPGNYVVTVNGKDGCLGQARATQFTVPAARVVRVAGR